MTARGAVGGAARYNPPMSSDLQALVAAIVADPSDDVARLVYADCLEEHGNAARAAFIRLQIEAERHHPDSNTRAAIETQAWELLAEHWIDWWGEVCAAVGFPMPAPRPRSRLGRFASNFGLRWTGGEPYRCRGFDVSWDYRTTYPTILGGVWDVTFQRGFPDGVKLNTAGTNVLPAWARVTPLRALSVEGGNPDSWLDGPHLASVRSVSVQQLYNPAGFLSVIGASQLSNLESMLIDIFPSEDDADPAPVAEALAQVIAAPWARRLKRLEIPLWDDRAAELVAGAKSLAGLEALALSLVSYMPYSDQPRLDGIAERVTTLARSQHLASVRELTVTGAYEPNVCRTLTANGNWTGLRKLTVANHLQDQLFAALLADARLPELEELRVGCVDFDFAKSGTAARSPLLKQLKHFSLSTNYRDLPALGAAVDANRIETLFVRLPTTHPGIRVDKSTLVALRNQFGDKLRIAYD